MNGYFPGGFKVKSVMPPSDDRSVDALLASLDPLGETMRLAVLSEIHGQLQAECGSRSARSIARLDKIVARLIGGIPLDERTGLASAFAALDADLPETMAAVGRDTAVMARAIGAGGRINRADIATMREAHRDGDLRLIAADPQIGADVADAISEHADHQSIVLLAANPSAELSERTIDRLIARSVRDERLQELLCERNDLTEAHLRRLVTIVPDRLKERLFGRLDNTDQAALAQEASRALAAKVRRMRLDREEQPSSHAILGDLKSGRRSLQEAVATLAATDNVILGLEVLLDAGGFDRGLATRLLQTVSNDQLAALSREVDVDAEACLALIAAIHRRLGRHQPDRRVLAMRFARLGAGEIGPLLAVFGTRRAATSAAGGPATVAV